jgi:hypothetical protein
VSEAIDRQRGARAREFVFPDDEYGGQVKLVTVFNHADRLVLTQTEVIGGEELAAFVPARDTLPELHGVLITAKRCTASAGTRIACTAGEGATRSRRGQPAAPAPGVARLPWDRHPDCSSATSDTAGSSPARPRSSTWTVHPKLTDSCPAPARSRSSAGAAPPASRPSLQTIYALTSLDHRAADPHPMAGWIRSP